MRLDGAFAENHNEVQKITAQKDEVVGKNKVLRREKKGNILLSQLSLSTYLTFWLTCDPLYVVELEKSMEHLEGTLTDWKCAFFREKNKREEVVQELEVLYHELDRELTLRHDGKVDLVMCMQS